VERNDANRIKHLEMIQGVINRMSTYSSTIRGWTVTLVVALVALAAKDGNLRYLYAGFLPALMFWGLDAYYLHLERGFRSLFESVAADDMQVSLFSLRRPDANRGWRKWLKTMFRPILVLFHLSIIIILAVLLVIFMNHPPTPTPQPPIQINMPKQ
jgi:hypothetical protein